MKVEIDQSGKLEQLNTGTAVAFSDGTCGVIWISVNVKREIIKVLRRTMIPAADIWSLVFAVVIFILIFDLKKNVILDIDEEYTGKDKIITEALYKLFKKKWGNKWNGEIRFRRVGKSSPVHKLAWDVHRKKNRQGVRKVKATEVLKLLE